MNTNETTRFLGIATAILLLAAGTTSLLQLRVMSLASGLILGISYLMFIVWICHALKPSSPWSKLATGFAAIYVVFVSFNYAFVLSFLGREMPIPPSMDMSLNDSVFLVNEMLGYLFMGLSSIAIIPLFSTSIFEKYIQALLALNGFLGIGGLIGYMMDWPMNLMYFGLSVWNLIMPLVCILIAIHFHKRIKESN